MLAVLDNTIPIFCAVTELANIRRLGYLPPGRMLNGLTNPLGESPARGWFCLRRRDLNRIDLNGNHAVTLTDDANRSVTIRNLVFASEPFNLTPGAAGDTDAVFLCEMADFRHLVAHPDLGVAINRQYNVRAADYSADATAATRYHIASLDGGSVWTWQTMVTNIWNLMSSFLGTGSTLPVTPDGTPEDWKFSGTSAWRALNLILHHLGMAVRWNAAAASNAYSIVQIGATDTIAARAQTLSADQLIFDKEFIPVVRGQVPGAVRVFFHKQFRRYGEEQTTPRSSDQWALLNDYIVDVTSPDSSADPNVIHPLWASIPALMDKDGTVTNSAALDTHAAEVAANYYRQLRGNGGGRLHRIYTGILLQKPAQTAFQPGSTIRGVVWRQDVMGIGTYQPGGLVTEIVRHPQWSIDNDGIVLDDDAGNTKLQPPDFRPTYAAYPHLFQKVRLTTGTADGSGRFTAKVQQYDSTARTWADKEDCYAVEHNGATQLESGSRYDARLSGYDTDRPVYTISGGSGPPEEPWCADFDLGMTAVACPEDPPTSSASCNSLTAKVPESGPQTVTSSEEALTANDTELWDTHNFHSTSSNTSRIVFAEAGNGYYLVSYRVSASVTFAGVDVTPENIESYAKYKGTSEINGSRDCQAIWRISITTGSTTTAYEKTSVCLKGTFLVNIADYANDYLEIFGVKAPSLNTSFSSLSISVIKLNCAGSF
jgi:hypothetical protein